CIFFKILLKSGACNDHIVAFFSCVNNIGFVFVDIRSVFNYFCVHAEFFFCLFQSSCCTIVKGQVTQIGDQECHTCVFCVLRFICLYFAATFCCISTSS